MRRAFSSTGAGLHQKGEVDAREGWALNVETGKLVQLIPVTACGPTLRIPLLRPAAGRRQWRSGNLKGIAPGQQEQPDNRDHCQRD